MGTYTSSPETLLNDYVVQQAFPQSTSSILRHKKTGVILLMRQVSTTSQGQMKSTLQRSYSRKDLTHEHYLTLKQIYQKSEGNLCSTLHRATILYQYGSHTLQHEIETRVEEGRRFQEKQLWSIICSCVLALAFLNRQSIQYECLSPSDVFLNAEGVVKIPDPDLSSGSFNGAFAGRTNNYFSPESLQGRHNPDKSCIFSLGMCVLQTMLMEPMSACYNFHDGKLDQTEVGQRLKGTKTGQQYSLALTTVLETMLTFDPKRRPSILELQGRLFNLLKEEPSWNTYRQSTYASSGVVDKKAGDNQIELDILSQKLQSMAPQKDEWVSLVVQTFVQTDQECPDDADDKPDAVLTDRSNMMFSCTNTNKNSDNGSKPQGNPKVQNRNVIPSQECVRRDEGLFTDPMLLEMLRRDIEDIHVKKSRHLNNSLSTEISVKVDTKMTFKAQPHHLDATQSRTQIQFKQVQSFSQDQSLRLVNESYTRGRYEGQKRGSARQGNGTFYYKQGGKYTGWWKNNKMHGKGTLYYANNNIAYEGDWVQDHLWGYGCLYNEDPQRLPHGYNYKSFDDVDEFWVKYEGQFVDDNKCGQGRLVLSNDQVYQGRFENDAIHGLGTFYARDGRVVKGEWKQNRLLRESR